MARRLQRREGAVKLAAFLLYAHWFLGKAAFFFGLPFEAWLITKPEVLFDPVYRALTRRNLLSSLSWALLLSTMYGVCQVVYGVLAGNKTVTALEILVFNLCPWYVFIGIWLGVRRPHLLRKFIRFAAWFICIYTVLYFVILRHINVTIPVVDMELNGRPPSGAWMILGLLCFEADLLKFWFPLLTCAFTTIANQIRADWLGFVIGLALWGGLTKRLGRVFSMAGVIVVLLAVGFILDIRLPPFPGRGGELSARDTIGRALSSVDPEMAREYSVSAGSFAGTVQWRENWWKAIREKVTEDNRTLIFGLGYGYPIKNLVPYLKNMEIRSPHSVFYFCLAYSGIIGVLLFFFLQISILVLFWRVFKESGQVFGFVWYVYILIGAFFGNYFENPQLGIPTYLLVGVAIAPLFVERSRLFDRPPQGNVPVAVNTPTPPPRGSRRLEQVPIRSRFAIDGRPHF